jgi:hypothetical protein
MSEAAPRTYRTGWLWAVLTLLLLLGTVSAAFVVYGFTDLLDTGRFFPDLLIMGVAGAAAVFFMLLLTGMLYRVDRLRGVSHRRIEIFE